MDNLDWGKKGLEDSDLLKKLYDVRNDEKYEKLYLRGNKLTSLPDLRTFRQFDNLKELDLWSNNLRDFDFSIIPPTVTRLDLRFNKLTRVGSLIHCTELEHLSVSYNQLTDVDWRNLPPALTRLYLGNNQLTTVGDVSQCTRLSELWVQYNHITHIEWRNLPPALTRLYLGNNQLTTVGDVSQCTRLSVLGVHNNHITHIEWRNLPPALTGLYLGNNQLTTVGDVSQCTRLSVLGVQNNHITHIEWRNLPPALTRLHLGNNQLTTVDLIYCTQLERLDLSYNPTLHTIESLPNKHIDDFYISESVKVLGRKCFHENNYSMLREECKSPYFGLNLEQPPVEVLRQGLEAVLVYYTEKPIRTTHTR